MENQVTKEVAENVVEKTVEVANEVAPAMNGVGLKELGYVALGAAGTVAVIFTVKKGKKLVNDLKDKKQRKLVVVEGNEAK